MIRAIIVDDESLARSELTRLIQQDKEFQIIGEAASGEQALEKMKNDKTDVVFLDIEMPKLNGLEVAGQLAQWPEPPVVVFATAYHQYAVEAFDAKAIDYILKPYDPKRVQSALERVKDHLKTRFSSRERLTSLEDYLIEKGTIKKLLGHKKYSKDRIVINPHEVEYFHAHYAEVKAHLGSQELIVNSTLKEILASLDPSKFAQTHKAYIVNLDKVEKVSPLFQGNFQITMKGEKPATIPLSRRFARNVKTLLGKW